ncbi:MAG TPA: PBP1A family penicillin-binding protein [Longimicrobiales bacterium]|nr:PBP1A family penicillin-binding protein [Longimicrobiales bacterium]
MKPLRRARVRLRWVRRHTYRARVATADRVRRLAERHSPRLAVAWRGAGQGLRRGLGRLGAFRPSPAVALVLILGGGALAGTAYTRCGFGGCPDVGRLASFQPGGAAVVLDRDGARFADFSPMDYAVVDLESLPRWVPEAFVAVEDRRFLEHGGVDWRRVAGAVLANVRQGRMAQGSSTLSMQLSRTLFADRIRREDRTLSRKLLEVRVARQIEERYDKPEILELYLNHIYLGDALHGVQAASRDLFGKDATELELHEAALLAALPRAPAHYDPRSRPEAARTRRNLVIALMEEQGRISPEEAAAGREADLGVLEAREIMDEGMAAPYFVQQVRTLLEQELGDRIYREPLRIHTTLDPTAQRAAQAELDRQLGALDRGAHGRLRLAEAAEEDASRDVQGAVVFMDPRTGDVLAWVGGRDYQRAPFDRVRLTRRQAGSVFKPFVYAAALEQGRVPSQPILDEPYRPGGDDDEWEPRNYSGTWEGRMSLREALVRSQNIPAVRLAHDIGSRRVADFVSRAGFREAAPLSPVAALGVTAVSPLEVVEAYSAFATDGRRATPRTVTRVEDADGTVIWSAEVERMEVTSPAVAFVVTDMLRDVVDLGTGAGVRGAGYWGPAAGKTGTTDGATDVWFAGYTPEIVGAVWIGFDGPGALPVRASGGSLAAPVWGRIMARIHARDPFEYWAPAPADVVLAEVDAASGMILASGCRPWSDGARLEYFLSGTEPGTVCPRQRGFIRRLGRLFGSSRELEDALLMLGEPDPELGVPLLVRAGAQRETRSQQ